MPDERKGSTEDGEVRDSGRERSRSRSPPRRWAQRKPKELSFYKRSAREYGRPAAGGGGGEEEEETAKERAQRRERGEVPRRFGGTRDQGVRNTMGNVSAAPAAVGSFKRTTDPLDRLGARGDKRSREERERDHHRDRERERERDRREREHDRDRDRDRRDRRDRDRDGDRPRRDDDRERERRDHVHPDRAAAAAGATGGDATTSSSTAAQQIPATKIRPGRMMEVIANDRMGRKVRIKCLPTDTVGDLKKLIAAQTGTSASKIQLKKWYNTFKDHVQLQDYEINDGMSLEMY